MSSHCCDSITALMDSAINGRLSKEELSVMLKPEFRPAFLRRCADIETRFTDECAALDDPCLASGCSVSGVPGEACLQPLQRRETEYRSACGAEWVDIFRNPAARSLPS
ncbi:MAG TPA: hypothetical protein VEU08_05120 [Vicinamibacterales bacterium]|nr:hypothetical protein [Vicinamibacterales bacterium]